MNTLCHLCLCPNDPELQIGQFLGDFLRGAVDSLDCPPRVKLGIRAHRRVDAVGDHHPLLREIKTFLPERERRFAGILFDLYGDYLLHRNWATLMQESWPDTVHQIEELLTNPPLPLPPDAASYADYLIRCRILQAYEQSEELPDIFDRVGRRFRRPVRLSEMLQRLQDHEPMLLKEFPAYFTEMKAASDEICMQEI